jgi:hypothetical protein
MSIVVKCFNEDGAKEELKKCPKIVRDYVKLLNETLKNQQDLTQKAIGKLRGLSKELEEANSEVKRLKEYEFMYKGLCK